MKEKNTNYIKLNNNDNHLSLGNFFNIVKDLSKNKMSAIQTEIFCILFEIENISETTVNNYCTGYRAIGNEYKQKYLNLQKKYQKDNTAMISIINNILSIIDGYIYNYQKIKEINKNTSIKNLTIKLHNLAKNDYYVTNKLKKEMLDNLNKSCYYEALVMSLFFIVLEKKQPIYQEDEIKETISLLVQKTNISVNDLRNYLLLEFQEGIILKPSLKKLAEENNPYALHELGMMEYNGITEGYPRYDKALYYFKIAAHYNHPTSNYMIAHIILSEKISTMTNNDIKLAHKYLENAIKLGSISAINKMGVCYVKGLNPNKEINIEKAIKYFNMAIKEDYVYSYNNLGKIHENNNDYQTAFNYYLKAANKEESWAANKVGEFYRLGKGTPINLEKAFYYYNLSCSSEVKTRCHWSEYNLAKYFYLNGNNTLNIKRDIDKAISLLNNLSFIEAKEELLYIYYKLYLNNKTEDNLSKLKSIIYDIESHHQYNNLYQQKIKKILEEIKYNHIEIP